MNRIFLIVLDSVGAGAAPDSAAFGDVGVNTLRSCAESGKLNIPNLIAAGLGTIDGVDCTGTLKNGVHFCIDGAAYVQYGYDSKMEIIGTKGKINVGRSDKEFVHCTTVENGTVTPFINSWMTLFIDAYLAEDTSFVNAVLNDTPVEVSGVDGRMAVATVEAGNCSITEKKIVTVR